MKPSRLALLCMAIVIIVAATASFATPWSYTAGGGASGPYQIRDSHYPDSFDPTWALNASAMHPIRHTLSLRFASSWARHGRDFGLTGVPEDPPAFLRQRVDLVPVSAGLRWQPPGGPRRDRPFLDLAPAVVWSRWYQRETQIGYNLAGDYIHRDEIASRTRILPALDLGMGVSFRGTERIHPEFAVRYLLSRDVGEAPIQSLAGQRIEGPKQWSAAVSFGWTR